MGHHHITLGHCKTVHVRWSRRMNLGQDIQVRLAMSTPGGGASSDDFVDGRGTESQQDGKVLSCFRINARVRGRQIAGLERIVDIAVGEQSNGLERDGVNLLHHVAIRVHDQVTKYSPALTIRIASLVQAAIFAVHQTREVWCRDHSHVRVGSTHWRPTHRGGLESCKELVEDSLAGVTLTECHTGNRLGLQVAFAEIVGGVAGAIRNIAPLFNLIAMDCARITKKLPKCQGWES